ncbi:MAG: ABC transporter permease [Anaerolineales bacterium]|nr:MAG: ABC transporter permease [Anaerolineales bacterium]
MYALASFLALVIASLGLINTTSMSVIERVRELGVRRAVGMTRQQVERMVLLEAAGVGVVGALLGGVVGLGAALMYMLTWSTVGLAAMGFGTPTWHTVRDSVNSTRLAILPNHSEGIGRRRRRDGWLRLPCPLPQGEALLVSLKRPPEREGAVIGQAELHQRPRRSIMFASGLQEGQCP